MPGASRSHRVGHTRGRRGALDPGRARVRSNGACRGSAISSPSSNAAAMLRPSRSRTNALSTAVPGRSPVRSSTRPATARSVSSTSSSGRLLRIPLTDELQPLEPERGALERQLTGASQVLGYVLMPPVFVWQTLRVIVQEAIPGLAGDRPWRRFRKTRARLRTEPLSRGKRSAGANVRSLGTMVFSMAADELVVHGAREHNLKDITVRLPRNALICITGLSGSGKSSLAFDTIYAEGQRRYVESLSAYARQFLQMMEKPDVDSIDGLSPAISIDQKTTSRNPRSTVGTVTEIYDYLRLLYARVGRPHCPICGRPIAGQAIDSIVEQILALPEGTRFTVNAPVVRDRKGEYRELFEIAAQRGLHARQGRRRAAPARGAADARQEVQAHDRGRRRPARDEGRPPAAAHAVGRDGGRARRGARHGRPGRRRARAAPTPSGSPAPSTASRCPSSSRGSSPSTRRTAPARAAPGSAPSRRSTPTCSSPTPASRSTRARSCRGRSAARTSTSR